MTFHVPRLLYRTRMLNGPASGLTVHATNARMFPTNEAAFFSLDVAAEDRVQLNLSTDESAFWPHIGRPQFESSLCLHLA